MQIIPNERFNNYPCSMVALYYAYRDIYKQRIAIEEIVKTRPDGYLALSKMNMYCNLLFHVKKATQYGSSKRFALKEFLKTNDKKCIICLLGHYIYCDGKDYYSFFDNEYCKIVKIWELDKIKDVGVE